MYFNSFHQHGLCLKIYYVGRYNSFETLIGYLTIHTKKVSMVYNIHLFNYGNNVYFKFHFFMVAWTSKKTAPRKLLTNLKEASSLYCAHKKKIKENDTFFIDILLF